MKNISTRQELNSYLNTHDKVVCLFSASWCAPCTRLKPIIEEMRLCAATVEAGQECKFDTDKVNGVSDSTAWLCVDVDDAEILCSEFNIASIPHIFFFKNKEVSFDVVGPQNHHIADGLKKLGIQITDN